MTYLCWNLEDKYSIKDMNKFQKSMTSTKGNFLQLLFDRDSFLELVELLHGSYLKDEEKNYKITQELLTTQDSLNNTQCALQESKMEIEQLHEELQIFHLPSYTPFIHLHKDYWILDHMEEYHEMVDHEMHSVLHVLEDYANNLDENQALDLSQRKLELFYRESLLSMEEWDELTLVGSSIDEEDASISLVDEYCRELIHTSSPQNSILST